MNPSQSVADVTDHNPTLLLTLRTQGIHRLQSLSLRSLGSIAMDGRAHRHFVLRIVTVLTYTVSSRCQIVAAPVVTATGMTAPAWPPQFRVRVRFRLGFTVRDRVRVRVG